jgi:aspartyl-tRNA(Asn)/glutamyl-tRNA(Gln) amidotransferase subunit A
MSAELDFMPAREMARRIARREISSLEATQRALAQAEATQASINAFSHIMGEQALDAARAADAATMRGDKLGPLHGVPYTAKDLIAVKGAPMTFGSRTMATNLASADAPVVERMNAAGAILVGKTTTSEFGCKAVGDNPLNGITRNPWNTGKTPGGSSAGAGASVAAGVTSLALGTDGGGSIRIPCCLTGLAGLKAQFGRIPLWPHSAAPSVAHVGPMTRDIRDAALMFMSIAGFDPRDPATVAGPLPDLIAACDAGVKGLRIAYSRTLGYAKPDPDVAAIIDKAAKTFEALGANIEPVEDVFASDPVDVWMAEFYASIGTRLAPILDKQRDLLDPAVVAILEQATKLDLRTYYTKVFERYALRERMRKFFERYDLLLSPTLAVASLDVGKNVPDSRPDRDLVSWVYYTYPFNLTGEPSATVCAGFSDGMPVGLQLTGRSHDEYGVVRAAAAFEGTRQMPKPAGFG